MNIEQIPADKLVKMTSVWSRAFKANGCKPACHGCWNEIPVGGKFKLATIEAAINVGNSPDRTETQSREVMLCETCEPSDVEKQDKQIVKNTLKRRKEYGCYRVNGKIVK